MAQRPRMSDRPSAAGGFRRGGEVPILPTEPLDRAPSLEPAESPKVTKAKLAPVPIEEETAPLKALTILIDERDHDLLREYAFRNRLSLQTLGIEALDWLFTKRGIGKIRPAKAYRRK